MQNQVRDLGGDIRLESVNGLGKRDDGFVVETSENTYLTKAVIVSGGATPRKAGFEGEQEFAGRGVSYCATCDGMFYRGKQVFVIGGGNSAAEEALFLTKFANKVTMVVRKDHMRAQASVQRQVDKSEEDRRDVQHVCQARVRRRASRVDHVREQRDWCRGHQRTTRRAPFGVFVFVGRVPASNLLGGLVNRDVKATSSPTTIWPRTCPGSLLPATSGRSRFARSSRRRQTVRLPRRVRRHTSASLWKARYQLLFRLLQKRDNISYVK